ncbi:STAS domain-containing protein [Haladaptatus sp. DJG-WS-42]|uniref:STAS domain-containing protein n=1 Tax=Haladaptatus sp. DJG-WS-42 TaxID=3120516 RepID=UPI0030D09BE0
MEDIDEFDWEWLGTDPTFGGEGGETVNTQQCIDKQERNMSMSDPSYQNLIENAPIGVFQASVDAEQLRDSTAESVDFYVNESLANILSFDSPEHLHEERAVIEHVNPEDEETFQRLLLENGTVEGFETTLVTNDNNTIDVLISGTFSEGEVFGYVTDITKQKRLEQKATAQAEAILELSTPIVQIWEGITLATVVGTLDTTRAQRLTEELLTELTENESGVALLDITGVANIDTATAQHLIDTVNAVSLLGSQIIITGINPEIAQTLVHLGITLDDIKTKSSLSAGLELGLNLIQDDPSATIEAS